MRRRVPSRRDLLRRIEALEARLAQPTPPPLAGQQAIRVPSIGHHTYLGPGDCREVLYGQVCGAHRDDHHLIADEDLAG